MNIYNVNLLIDIIDRADEYIEENNGIKYLTLVLVIKTKKCW